jgi:hypothetical protein
MPPKLGFPWIPLAESGLFNGLQRIQGKKFSPFASAAARPIIGRLVGFRHLLKLAQIPFFVKKFQLELVNRTDRVVLA